MKKPMLTVVAGLGAVLSALSQGVIYLDNSGILPGLTADRPGNWYSGTFGMEVWMLNSRILPAGINLSPAAGAGILGYNAMAAAGFRKEMTYAGQTTCGVGSFCFGAVDMLDVWPAGATVVLALAAWNTGDASWSAMLANANPATRAGVLAFLQPTTDPAVGGMSPKDLGMDRDLVLSEIPEPAGLALAGLGGALLLLSRRRRQVCRDPPVGTP